MLDYGRPVFFETFANLNRARSQSKASEREEQTPLLGRETQFAPRSDDVLTRQSRPVHGITSPYLNSSREAERVSLGQPLLVLEVGLVRFPGSVRAGLSIRMLPPPLRPPGDWPEQ